MNRLVQKFKILVILSVVIFIHCGDEKEPTRLTILDHWEGYYESRDPSNDNFKLWDVDGELIVDSPVDIELELINLRPKNPKANDRVGNIILIYVVEDETGNEITREEISGSEFKFKLSEVSESDGHATSVNYERTNGYIRTVIDMRKNLNDNFIDGTISSYAFNPITFREGLFLRLTFDVVQNTF